MSDKVFFVHLSSNHEKALPWTQLFNNLYYVKGSVRTGGTVNIPRQVKTFPTRWKSKNLTRTALLYRLLRCWVFIANIFNGYQLFMPVSEGSPLDGELT